MQTFLPLPLFSAAADCLDNKRLGKQRVECKQILLCLGVPVGEHKPGKSSWFRHPAVRMWAGHEVALAVYSAIVCRAWRQRGFKDTLYLQFLRCGRQLVKDSYPIAYPAWVGDDRFHASHRSNLLRKDYGYYSQFGWHEPDDLPYYWPVDAAVAAV